VPELQAGEPTTHWTPLFDTGAVEAQPIIGAGPPSEPLPTFVAPELFPGTDQYLKRWTFVLVVTGVWTVAAGAGLALYEWWFQSADKTGPLFVLLVYIVVGTVAALLVAMVQNKPLVSAVAIALMSAPLASTGAAAALYGAYVFHWIDR
jgi:RsiW-degrading membrane proteinase PrsW (M82 family)